LAQFSFFSLVEMMQTTRVFVVCYNRPPTVQSLCHHLHSPKTNGYDQRLISAMKVYSGGPQRWLNNVIDDSIRHMGLRGGRLEITNVSKCEMRLFCPSSILKTHSRASSIELRRQTVVIEVARAPNRSDWMFGDYEHGPPL